MPPGWGGPQHPPPPGHSDGLHTAAIVLAVVGGALFLIGLVPCLGWLNWLGVPLNLAGLIVGIVGLSKGQPNNGAFIAATVVCAIGMLGGLARCLLGGLVF